MDEQSENNDGSPWRSVFYWHLGLLILIPLIAFSTAIPCGYVWLDHTEIEEAGYRITSFDDFGKLWSLSLDDYQLRNHGETRTLGGYWRPVYAISISLDWWLWGENPFQSHVVNILLHIGVAILLYFLALDVLPEKSWKQDAAFFSALLFAVLPINVSSVTWISGRKDILAALFSLAVFRLAFWFSATRLRFNKDDNSAVFGKKLTKVLGYQAATALSVALAVLSKELAFILPAVFFVTLLLIRQLDSNNLFDTNDWTSFWVITGTVAVFWLIRRGVTGVIELSRERPGDTLIEELLTLAIIWWRHLIGVLWPYDPLLSDRITVYSASSPIGWLAAISILLIGVACILILIYRWRIGYGLVWYVLWTFPTSGILTLRHWYAERYLYPASWGIILLIMTAGCLLAERVLKSPFQRVLVTRLSCGCLVTLLATFTLMENQNWSTDETLFTHAIGSDPYYFEGHAALAERALNDKRYGEVIQHSKHIVESNDDARIISYWSRPVVHTNLGLAYFYTDQYDQAEQQFLIARKLQPNQSAVHYHLGLVSIALKQRSAAETHFRRALKLNPSDDLARGNLAYVLLASARIPKLKESMEILKPIINDEASTLDLRNYGSVALVLKEWDQAKSSFTMILGRKDVTAGDVAKLAWSEFRLNNRQAAEKRLDQAFEMDPDDPVVLSYSRLIQK